MVNPSELRQADQVSIVVHNDAFCVSATLIEEKCSFLHQRIDALLSHKHHNTKTSELSSALSSLQFHHHHHQRFDIRLVDHKRDSGRLQRLAMHTILPPLSEAFHARSSRPLPSPLKDKENVNLHVERDDNDDSTKSHSGPTVIWIELSGASTKVVDVLLKFLATNRVVVAGAEEIVDCGEPLMDLCKFLLLENSELVFETLKLMIDYRLKWCNMVDFLLKVTLIKQSPERRQQLLDLLFSKLTEMLTEVPTKLSTSSCSRSLHITILEEMKFAQLVALEDVLVLCQVICIILKHVHHAEIWQRLRHALELWISCRLPRTDDVTATTTTTTTAISLMDSNTTMPCLLRLHHSFVEWPPWIPVDNKTFSGLNCFLVAQTVCTFGPFELQIRLEMNVTKFIQWRVIASSSSGASSTPTSFTSEMAETDSYELFGTRFVLRGRLSVWVWPLAQRFLLSLRYEHHRQVYGKWRVLLRLASKMPADIKAASASAGPPSNRQVDVDFNRFDLMSVTLAGSLFVWGHPLCNLYHFLLNSTLFASTTKCSSSPPSPAATISKHSGEEAIVKRTPLETLYLVLQSDSLRIDQSRVKSEAKVIELILAMARNINSRLQVSPSTGTTGTSANEQTKKLRRRQLRRLVKCIRWHFTDCVDRDHNCVQTDNLTKLQQRFDDAFVASGIDPIALTPLVTSSLSNQRLQIPRRVPFWK